MAIYHLSMQIISRGNDGKSAVAAAAYRAGETIKNEYDGVTHDYTRKEGVVHTEILLPANAPAEYADRAVLWNAVEKIEKAHNSQLAREFEISLPAELTFLQNRSLIREYVKRNFVDKGMIADICIHDKNDGNPHAHVMLTMRPFNENGTWGSRQKKHYILDDNGEKMYDPIKRQYKCKSIPSTDWSDRAKAEEWREAWAVIANKYLEKLNIDARIDHRSYERQGIDQIPTIHLGAAAHQMEKRGIRTERGDINRAIVDANKELRQLNARIGKLRNWLKEEAVNIKPPTLADVITQILTQQGQSGVTRLKNASQILMFLTENDITDVAGLENKVNAMRNNVTAIREKLKPVERRLNTLDEHIKHGENFKNYRSIKRKYRELYSIYETAQKATGFGAARKAQKALDAANEFFEAHRSELYQYDTAEEYLKDVLQERFDPKKLPPITKWKEERETKHAVKYQLNNELISLKEDTQKVEQIKRSVTDILGGDTPKRKPQKSQDMEL